jgi:pimeloyl-ACP methyl ester carboxylesterase
VSRLNYLTLSDPSNPARPRHLAYYEWGDAANPDVVVCVHGLSRNGRDFDSLAQALASRYRILCPDMAGRGKSDWLTSKTDYSYATYVADMFAFFNALQLKKVDWLGTSMGGIIGMMLAAQQQGHIGRLILNDIGSVVSATGLKRILSYVGSSSVFAHADEAMATLKSIIAPFGITSEAHWQYMFTASFNPLPDGRYAFAYDPDISKPLKETLNTADAITDIDLTAIWNAIQCPVLILRGAQSDILARTTALAMCQRTAPTRLVEFEGAGHAPALLDEVQIRTVVDWLDIGH